MYFRVWSSMEPRFHRYSPPDPPPVLSGSFNTDPDAKVTDGRGGATLRQDTSNGHFDMSGTLRKHGHNYFVKVTPKGTNTGPYTLNLRTSSANCSGVLN